MSKTTKRSILLALVTLGLIVFAMWLRYASRTILHHPFYGYLRSGIYIFLFCMWGISLHLRIIQMQVRRYLVTISVLMVLWLLLRSIKFSINSAEAGRWLWYFYYGPILYIPMMSLSLFPCHWAKQRTSACRDGQSFCIYRRFCCFYLF